MTGIPSWAVVGAKVVCTRSVKKLPPELVGRVNLLEKGAVYTLRKVRFSAEMFDTQPCVLLDEVQNDSMRVEDDYLGVAWNGEPHFGLGCFRPLVTRSQEQDIAEHFASHLHQRVPEKA